MREKGKMKKEEPKEVLINIGLMTFNETERKLKPKQEKKLALKITSTASYRTLLQEGEKKWNLALLSSSSLFLRICRLCSFSFQKIYAFRGFTSNSYELHDFQKCTSVFSPDTLSTPALY